MPISRNRRGSHPGSRRLRREPLQETAGAPARSRGGRAEDRDGEGGGARQKDAAADRDAAQAVGQRRRPDPDRPLPRSSESGGRADGGGQPPLSRRPAGSASQESRGRY